MCIWYDEKNEIQIKKRVADFIASLSNTYGIRNSNVLYNFITSWNVLNLNRCVLETCIQFVWNLLYCSEFVIE